MQILRKLLTAGLLVVVVILATGLTIFSFGNRGAWTLLYIIEAGLLMMYAYVYLPVLLTLLAFPWLKRMARPDGVDVG